MYITWLFRDASRPCCILGEQVLTITLMNAPVTSRGRFGHGGEETGLRGKEKGGKRDDYYRVTRVGLTRSYTKIVACRDGDGDYSGVLYYTHRL